MFTKTFTSFSYFFTIQPPSIYNCLLLANQPPFINTYIQYLTFPNQNGLAFITLKKEVLMVSFSMDQKFVKDAGRHYKYKQDEFL